MRDDSDFSVIEIGMNHPGEIAPLSILANPDVALITSVAPAHLAAFKSIEGIAQEKASVVEGLKSDGSIIINGDIPTAETVMFEIISNNYFGRGKNGKEKRKGKKHQHIDCTIMR